MRPNTRAASATAASISGPRVTSICSGSARRPSARIASVVPPSARASR